MVNETALEHLQNENIPAFNAMVENMGGEVDLQGVHLRSYDLRKANLSKANLANAYMRNTDLRGANLSNAYLDGASIKDAKVSGVMFPRDIDAHELMMSLQHGTRIRHNRQAPASTDGANNTYKPPQPK